MSEPVYKFKTLFCKNEIKAIWLSNPTLSKELSLSYLFANYSIAFQFIDLKSTSPDHKDMTTPIYYYNVNQDFDFVNFTWFVNSTLWRHNLSFCNSSGEATLYSDCPRIIIYHLHTTFFEKKILNIIVISDLGKMHSDLYLNICRDLKIICDNPKVDFFEPL